MPARLLVVTHPVAVAVQAAGAAAASFAAFLLAQAPPVVADHPTPVVVALGVGLASVFAPGLIREMGEFLRRKQARQAVVEDRDFQGQLDRVKADAAAAHEKADAAEARVAQIEANAEAAEIRALAALKAAADAHAEAAGAKVRIRNLERRGMAAREQIEANAADAAAAQGLAFAGLDAARGAGLLPTPLPSGDEIPAQPLVLLVEDDPASTKSLCALLPGHGFRVMPVAKVRDALLALSLNPQIIALDMVLVDGSGEEVVRRCKQNDLPARIFVMSGMVDDQAEARLLRMGVEAVLHKPIGDLAALAELMKRPAAGR